MNSDGSKTPDRTLRTATFTALFLLLFLLPSVPTQGAPNDEVSTVAANAGSQMSNLVGSWKLKTLAAETSILDVTFTDKNTGSHDHTAMAVEASHLGLSSADLNAAMAHVDFQLQRPAGVFRFSGTVEHGVGAGDVSFDADEQYLAEIRHAGFAPTYREQVELGLFDVTAQEARSLQRAFPQITPEELAGFSALNISQQYALDVHRLLPQAEPLGVMALFLKKIQITYISAIKRAGVTDLNWHNVVALHNSGVSSDYIASLGSVGYKNLSSEDLEGLHSAGVDAPFIRALAKKGMHGLSVQRLIALKSTSQQH